MKIIFCITASYYTLYDFNGQCPDTWQKQNEKTNIMKNNMKYCFINMKYYFIKCKIKLTSKKVYLRKN